MHQVETPAPVLLKSDGWLLVFFQYLSVAFPRAPISENIERSSPLPMAVPVRHPRSRSLTKEVEMHPQKLHRSVGHAVDLSRRA